MSSIARIIARQQTRMIALFLLIFPAFFLNIVVPGHTRGLITLAGGGASPDSQRQITDSCCASHSHGSHSAPSQKDRANCAICHLAARYTPPPVVDFRLDQIDLVELLP